jgi:DNA polymerase III alpha subunit
MFNLPDRVLHPNGQSIVSAEQCVNFLLRGLTPVHFAVEELTPDIIEHNRRSVDKILSVSELKEPDFDLSYAIPVEYQQLDVCKYFLDKLEAREEWRLNDAIIDRVENELVFIQRTSAENYFRTIIYIVDRLNAEKVVYGIGRGSSCASFLLYMIGLHTVNPIEYEIPMEEFFH